MTDINLRKLVAAVLDASETTDPTTLAREIAAKVPARSLRAYLAEALAPYVREQIQHARSAANAARETPGPSRSSKVAAIRSWSRKQLRERYHVGYGVWKFLGDFTYEDLVFAASERRQHAARNMAKAAQFDQLAELVRARGVATVAELAEADLEQVAA